MSLLKDARDLLKVTIKTQAAVCEKLAGIEEKPSKG